MKKNLLKNFKITCILSLLAFSLSSSGQDIRSYDGSGNNLTQPEWGAVNTNQLQVVSNGFSDGVSEPGGLDRPNPREISNIVFNQDILQLDAMELSDYAWAWGQFIDHDITLVGENPDEGMSIEVPTGDPWFDPFATGLVAIGMHRSAYDPDSGTSPSNPRAFPNSISSFVDGSGVYGSDQERADWLRTFSDGKLKTSNGNLLPYNTTNGELTDPVDQNAPGMAMPFPATLKWFIAGDIRANENPLLISIHTLFVREHNRLCEQLAVDNPDWLDEELYQHARKIVGGLIQSIVYQEWLPTMGVHIDQYSGYDPSIEVGIMNVFSASAYRYGHSVINGTILRMDNYGNTIPQGNLLLKDAFFNPWVINNTGGIGPFLKGMATQIEQDFDCKMIHDLRNFLFGPPGAGGLDLAAININRGRERGLPDYNTIRQNFGLSAIEGFNNLSNNPWLNQILEGVYGDIDDMDSWVGFLAEDHMSNALFGESVMTIMKSQFTILRDGDRFYYENDLGLSQEEINTIKGTNFRDIIYRNSSATGLQENVFLAREPTSTAIAESVPLKMDVYPNPSSGTFFINISSEKQADGKLRVSDMLGHPIQEVDFNTNAGMNTIEFQLDENLASGLYNVNLYLENRIGHQRLFINSQ